MILAALLGLLVALVTGTALHEAGPFAPRRLPLPLADGGWVVTALVNGALHGRRMRLPTEMRWHLAALPYALAAGAAGLGAGLWYGLAR